jgi:hypothetical protein
MWYKEQGTSQLLFPSFQIAKPWRKKVNFDLAAFDQQQGVRLRTSVDQG